MPLDFLKSLCFVNPLAKSHFNQSLSSYYHKNKNKKKRNSIMKNTSGMSNVKHDTLVYFCSWWYESNPLNFYKLFSFSARRKDLSSLQSNYLLAFLQFICDQ